MNVSSIIANWESVHAHMPVCEVEQAEWEYDTLCDPEHIALMEAVIEDLDLPVCLICGNVLRPLYNDITPGIHESYCSLGQLIAYRNEHDYH